MLRGVQDLSRCMTSGNQKYFGKSRQVSLGLLALRNFPFAIISMHFPQLQTPHPLGGGGGGFWVVWFRHDFFYYIRECARIIVVSPSSTLYNFCGWG